MCTGLGKRNSPENDCANIIVEGTPWRVLLLYSVMVMANIEQEKQPGFNSTEVKKEAPLYLIYGTCSKDS